MYIKEILGIWDGIHTLNGKYSVLVVFYAIVSVTSLRN